jgi:hypothetical protein
VRKKSHCKTGRQRKTGIPQSLLRAHLQLSEGPSTRLHLLKVQPSPNSVMRTKSLTHKPLEGEPHPNYNYKGSLKKSHGNREENGMRERERRKVG